MRSIRMLLVVSTGCFILFTGRAEGHHRTTLTRDTIPSMQDSFHFSYDRLDTIGIIVFPEVTIRFNARPGFKFLLRATKDPNDTLDIQVDTGTTLQGQMIAIESRLLTDITVEQGFRTSLCITNEKERFVLNGWTHYNSALTPMPASGSIYYYRPYSNEEKSRFPAVGIEEMRKYLLATPDYGKPIADLTNQAKSMQDDPLSIVIGIEQLRILGTRKDNGTKVTKTIQLIIEQPREYL